MTIAIHKGKGFSNRWIEYCELNKIKYKLVDCYSNSIIDDLRDCDALMWHFHQASFADNLFAKQLLFAVESSGKKVFPDFNTSWHFDDKIGQKYLLESIGAPFVPSYVFYSKNDAIKWLAECKLPLVFKLRCGASSQNVRLVKTRKEGMKIISKAFGKGFKTFCGWHNFEERTKKYREGLDDFRGVLKGFRRIFIAPASIKIFPNQKSYVYFQDFIPGNDSDIRVIVIGDKAFAIKRMVRRNDFRASGSGKILYSKELFDNDTIQHSFCVAKQLKTQCIAIDFIKKQGHPLITEISYGFSPIGYYRCPGYWDTDLRWHEGEFNPYGWMVESVLRQHNSELKH